ncbi:unnamed protein product, partial [Tetraodon nigroviridis]
RSQAGTQLPLDRSFIQEVTERYNASLVFPPADGRLLFSVREPIVNRVFFSSRQRGFASRSAPCARTCVCARVCDPDVSLLQAVCALALLGRLHGGGRGDVLRVQRRRHRHHQHQRGRPPAHGGSGRLRPGHLTPPSPAGGGGPGPAGAGRDQDQSGSSSWVT